MWYSYIRLKQLWVVKNNRAMESDIGLGSEELKGECWALVEVSIPLSLLF